MVDGIDGSGKSTIVRAIVDELGQNKRVFDISEWSKKNHALPSLEDCEQADIINSTEPTYAWVGAAIRGELIKKRTSFKTADIAAAFSLDRLILYKRLLIPLLEAGKTIVQDRGVSSTIAYQGADLNLEQVIALSGNQLTLEHAPDVLIIADCSADTALKRLAARTDKQDEAIFEDRTFLEELRERYQAPWFQDLWKEKGTKLISFDTEPSIEEVKSQTKKLVQSL